MLIGWVADLTIEEHRGGGQQTNHEMVIAGRNRSHIIDYIIPNNCKNIDINKYDLLILNKVSNFTQDIKRLMIKKSYIKYEHDYECVRNDQMCENIYENSLLNIFLSPLHYKTFNKEYKKRYNKNIERIFLQPSPVSGFEKIEKRPTKNTVIWAGELHHHKGVYNVIEYVKKRKDLKFDFYLLKHSDTTLYHKIRMLNNVRITGEIKNKKDMNIAYSAHEYFIHLPSWKEPFGRTVLEAYLSGCRLIVNKNVGVMSYGWDFNNYEEITEINKKSTDNFWKKVENIK